MKLDPEQLEVTTFDAGASVDSLRPPTDPTANTDCYWCPGDTFDCA